MPDSFDYIEVIEKDLFRSRHLSQVHHDKFHLCNLCENNDLESGAWEIMYTDYRIEYVCSDCVKEAMKDLRGKIMKIEPYKSESLINNK